MAYWRWHDFPCHHEEVPSEMPEVLQAHAEYKRADAIALEMRWRARARLGRAILAERDKGTPQEAIARRLERTREQVRRYEQSYRDWLKGHDGTQPD